MSSNTTANQNCNPKGSTAAVAALTVCYCVLILAVLVGNTLVVAVVCKNKNLRKTVNWFLLNVAISDLLVPFVFIVPEVTALLTGSWKWHLSGVAGSLSCKLLGFLGDVSPSVSAFGLVLISFERFLAVVFPWRASFINSKVRVALIASSWIIAVGLASPYFYTFKLIPFDNFVGCVHDWTPAFDDHASTEKRYRVTLYIITVIVPFILLFFFYTCILISIRRRSSTAEQLNQIQRSQRARENSKVTRTAVAIVIAFAVCFGPANAFNFIQLFLANRVKIDYSLCSTATFGTVAKVLVCLNGALNPVICFIFLKGYRKSLKMLFCPSSHMKPRFRKPDTLMTSETNV